MSLSHTYSYSFRWVYLSLDNLARKNTPRQIQASLHGLPASLEDIYANILRSIPEEDRSFIRRALLWLTFARRPLTLVELNEAIVMEHNQMDIDENDRICREEMVLESCHGLVDCYDGLVSLAHSSVEKFLTTSNIKSLGVDSFGLNLDDGDRILMRECLQYLSMTPFTSGYLEKDEELRKTCKQYPLLKYAALSWASHASRFQLNQEDKAIIMGFLKTCRLPRGGNHSAWVRVYVLNLESSDLTPLSTTHPLYYATLFGLRHIVEIILQEDKDVDVNAIGGRMGCTPLFIACWREYYDIASLLFRAGADASISDHSTGFTPPMLLFNWGAENPEAQKLLRAMDPRMTSAWGSKKIRALKDYWAWSKTIKF